MLLFMEIKPNSNLGQFNEKNFELISYTAQNRTIKIKNLLEMIKKMLDKTKVNLSGTNKKGLLVKSTY